MDRFGNASPAKWLVMLMFTVGLVSGCTKKQPDQNGSSVPSADLTIISGSEHKDLEPIIKRFADQQNARITMTYAGSVDISLRLEDGTVDADAVWPANSLWITMGDTRKQVKDAKSIMRTPVVLGVKKSVASRLGWIGKEVRVADILRAAQSGQLRYMMTSATQSNSGASAYFGYLYAFAGRPEVLTHKDLQKPEVRTKIKQILGAVNRQAGSSGFLRDLFVQRYDDYDAMVNYESLIIDANRTLVASNREPLYVIYPVDGLAIADSPLGFIDHGNARKSELFHGLQAYLLQPDIQKEIAAKGYRTGLLGLKLDNPDPSIFNPEWGIHTDRTISTIRFPDGAVIKEALNLYQTTFRKPSNLVFALDYSGSMEGERLDALKSAMRRLLDPAESSRILLQGTPDDTITVIIFSGKIRNTWTVKGNNPKALGDLLAKINSEQAGGQTDIYTPVEQALSDLKASGNMERASSAVILMTDGQSNTGDSINDLRNKVQQLGMHSVPVYPILFGEADTRQLNDIAQLTSGKVFDGKTDLKQAFREARSNS